MQRRQFLQAAGFSLVLPALESLGAGQAVADSPKIKRFFLMTDGYGFHTPYFFPTKTGNDYPGNDVLTPLQPLRKHVTLLGGLRHLSGHANQRFVATGTPSSANFGDSIDQYIARRVSAEVPIESLLLSTRKQATGGSFRNKIPVAMLYDPEEAFDALFTKGDVRTRNRELLRRQSVLDLCLEQAKSLSGKVAQADRRRLDDYFESIRETEKLVKKDQKFLHEPAIDPGFDKTALAKHHTNGAAEPYFSYLRTQVRFVEVAFQFDLTRVAYLFEHGQNHGATHHGGRTKPGDALYRHARGTVEAIASTLTKFANTKTPGGGTLLDETLFLWTAALGNAAGHTGNNTPAILAGGGLPHHGRYVHFDTLQQNTKLYLYILRQMGIDADNFGDSSRTLSF